MVIIDFRLNNWKGFVPKLENQYDRKIITILGDKKHQEVTDQISDAIEGATN